MVSVDYRAKADYESETGSMNFIVVKENGERKITYGYMLDDIFED